MKNRRSFLTVVVSAGFVSLSGCGLLEDNDDDELSEEQIRAVQRYEDGHETHQTGLNALSDGFSHYHDEDYDDASESFRDAEDAFDRARDDFVDMPYPDFDDDNEAADDIQDEATSTSLDGESIAQRAAFDCERLVIGTHPSKDESEVHEDMEEWERTYENSGLSIPEPSDFEEVL